MAASRTVLILMAFSLVTMVSSVAHGGYWMATGQQLNGDLAVFQSSDGAGWQQLEHIPSASRFKVTPKLTYCANRLRVVAVSQWGDLGVLTSEDHGKSWIQESFNPYYSYLTTSFLSQRHLMALPVMGRCRSFQGVRRMVFR